MPVKSLRTPGMLPGHHGPEDLGAANRLLKPFAAGRRAWLLNSLVLLFAVFVWAAVGLGPYSGEATPPNFGDFEAQRHWMEITQHLVPRDWYFYDFDWWRLDYPPLTAYHSWLCGWIGSSRFFNADWFALDDSRGNEDPGLKAFMRTTVIASQLLVFVPALCWYMKKVTKFYNPLEITWSVVFGQILLLPSLVIIDHGHFQYNSVMLGLFIASLTAFVMRHFVISSIFFVLSLFFKQMALYYAPVIFFGMLGKCYGPFTKWKFEFKRLVTIGFTVLATSAVLLIPFYDLSQLQQIFTRVFPVFRGLWEDKVANLWCTLNYTVLKLKSRFDPQELQLMALASTLVGIAPSCYSAYRSSSLVITWAFSNCAWAFYLFSFQVHEKSVLLPLIPSSLLAVQHLSSRNIRAMTTWINNVAYFSMWPLLKREGLQLQYFVLFVLWNWLFTGPGNILPRNWLNKLAVAGSYTFFAALAIVEFFDLAPYPYLMRYPDIFVVGNMAASFGCFVYFWLWQSYYMLSLN